MQIINILGDQQHIPRPFGFEACKRVMGGIGDNIGVHQGRAAVIIEMMHQIGVIDEGVRGGDLGNIVFCPNAIGIAECVQSAFFGNSGPGQNDNRGFFSAQNINQIGAKGHGKSCLNSDQGLGKPNKAYRKENGPAKSVWQGRV